jgi:hypothetical protein
MDIRLVRVKDISKRDEQAWRELAVRALEPNPFFESEFLVLCVRHFESYANTTLVVAEDGDGFRGVFPVVSFEKPRIPPRMVASTGGRPRAGRLLDTPLVDSSCADQAMGALLDGLHGAVKQRGWPGIVAMDMVGIDGPVVESLRRMCAERWFPIFTKAPWERAMVSRVGRWANPLDGDRRREIGRRQRLITKETGEQVAFVDRTADPTALDDFLKMEMAGWKGGPGGQAFGRSPENDGLVRGLASTVGCRRPPDGSVTPSRSDASGHAVFHPSRRGILLLQDRVRRGICEVQAGCDVAVLGTEPPT